MFPELITAPSHHTAARAESIPLIIATLTVGTAHAAGNILLALLAGARADPVAAVVAGTVQVAADVAVTFPLQRSCPLLCTPRAGEVNLENRSCRRCNGHRISAT